MNEEMWKNASVLARLVSISAQASEMAGMTIKNVMASRNLRVINKDLEGGNDFQTEADRSAQAGIEAKLKSTFGNKLQIVGEEDMAEQLADPQTHQQKELTPIMKAVLEMDSKIPEDLRALGVDDLLVWVDPLDGTGEYVRGLDNPSLLQQVTVLIGITHQGRAIAGVVHQPYYKRKEGNEEKEGRTIWGIARVGTFGLEITKKEPAERYAVSTASHATKLVDEALTAVKIKGLISGTKTVGGAGYKVLCCLEGAAAYVYASGGTKKWDTAATEAVLRAAGGELTDLSGRPLHYEQHGQTQNSGGVLATAPWVEHQKFLDAIPQNVKDKLPEKLSESK